MNRWPHAPSHLVVHPGAYIVTGGTYLKEHFFADRARLQLLEEYLLASLEKDGWQVQQWAVFSNHYHFVGFSPESGADIGRTTGRVHTLSSRDINLLDGTDGRKVWHRCWDTRLSIETSYLARLNYVRCNAVKHGLVRVPEDYEFCSASWFAERAKRSFFETVASFGIEEVNVEDDF
jgi:putative transposase